VLLLPKLVDELNKTRWRGSESVRSVDGGCCEEGQEQSRAYQSIHCQGTLARSLYLETFTSLFQLVADNKVKYKHLAGGVVFVPLVPKNPSGKIMRRVLKEQVKEQAKVKL
jgi:acyl-CoA synthetase (AMP-forming)/AMP-acid ligase II